VLVSGGMFPFAGNNATAVFAAIKRGEYPPPATLQKHAHAQAHAQQRGGGGGGEGGGGGGGSSGISQGKPQHHQQHRQHRHQQGSRSRGSDCWELLRGLLLVDPVINDFYVFIYSIF
jgi:hypothetical protein